MHTHHSSVWTVMTVSSDLKSKFQFLKNVFLILLYLNLMRLKLCSSVILHMIQIGGMGDGLFTQMFLETKIFSKCISLFINVLCHYSDTA